MVTWSDDCEPYRPTDPEGLRAFLTAVHRKALGGGGFFVDLWSAVGDRLSIGLGESVAVLCGEVQGKKRPYFIASDSGDFGRPIQFTYHGIFTEFAPTQAISVALAIEVAVEFGITGELSGEVEWTFS
jgi:hypothetical protein